MNILQLLNIGLTELIEKEKSKNEAKRVAELQAISDAKVFLDNLSQPYSIRDGKMTYLLRDKAITFRIEDVKNNGY